jgi:O-antigen/teichoic acid export membrane protein
MVTLRNFNLVLGGDLIAKAFNALALLAAMRYLKPHEFGDYVFISAIALAAYGFFNGFFNRRIVFNKISEGDLPSMELVAVGLTALAFAAISAFSSFKGWTGLAGLAVAGAGIAYDFRRSCLQRAGTFRVYIHCEIVRSAFVLVTTLAILWLLSRDRAAWLLSALALSYALGALALTRSAFGAQRLSPVRIVEGVHSLWTRESLQLLAFFVLLGLVAQLPPLLYKPFASTGDYAEFGVAFRYYGLLVAITSAFHVVMMPAIASVSADQASGLVRRMLLMGLFSLALVFAGVLTGYMLMPVVDGGKYPAAPKLFALLSLGLVFGIYSGLFISSSLRAGRYTILIIGQLASLLISAGILWRYSAEHVIAAAAAMPVGLGFQLLIFLGWYRQKGLIGLLTETQAP